MSVVTNKYVHNSIKNRGILKLVVSPQFWINGLRIPTTVRTLQSLTLEAQIHDVRHCNNLLVRALNVFLDLAGIGGKSIRAPDAADVEVFVWTRT